MRRTILVIPSPSPVIERRPRVFRRIFVAAILAGLVGGLLVTALQAAKLAPLIAAAERYETAAEPAMHGESEWQPAEGLERTAFTLLANIVIAVGFGLLLGAAFGLRQVLAGAETDLRQGILWGIAAFACFSLAPSLGLPPELPGSASADLFARQSWWMGTALATATGIGLLAFARRLPWRLLGIVVLLLPHLAGAPRPAVEDGVVPANLAAEFAAASLVIAAVFWIVLGGVSGWLYARLARAS